MPDRLGLTLVCLLLALAPVVAAPATPVVVDTDVALDDIRALALLMQSRHFDILAIVCSDGSAAPEVGATNIARVLGELKQTDIPIGFGCAVDAPPPPWRQVAESLGWSDLPAARPDITVAAVPLLSRCLRESEQPVLYICLGPLTNLAALLTADPALSQRIKTIHYWGSPLGFEPASWNTTRDTAAARQVFASDIPVYATRIAEEQQLTFDSTLYRLAAESPTPAASLLERIHENSRAQRMLNQGHFRAWDETVVLSLLDTTLIRWVQPDSTEPVFQVSCWDRDRARQNYIRLLQMGKQDE